MFLVTQQAVVAVAVSVSRVKERLPRLTLMMIMNRLLSGSKLRLRKMRGEMIK